MRILLTGGHLTPALTLIQNSPKHEFIYIGRPNTHEQIQIQTTKSLFIPLITPKINRYKLWISLLRLPLIIVSLVKAYKIIKIHRPDVVISFGSYMAIPICLVAKIVKIPIIIHEQTTVAGLANQLIGKFANIITISYPQSMLYFPQNKTFLIGNLIRPGLLIPRPPQPSWLKSKLPIIYVTGGSQGSSIINKTIQKLLPEITSNYMLVHQYGKQPAPKTSISKNYYSRSWFDVTELAYIYKHARMVVSRSGANTTSEIIAFSLPSILIPLPHTHLHEQEKNAALLSENGGCVVIAQEDLTPKALQDAITTISINQSEYQNNLKKLSNLFHPSASTELIKLAKKLCQVNPN